MQMLDLELLDKVAALGRWSLEGLWLPLLAWTAIALPVYLFVKVRESLSPHVRYWTLVAVLVSLPLGLAAAALAFLRPEAVQEMTFVAIPAIITVAAPTLAAQSFVWTVWHTAGAALILAGLLAAWRGGVLAAGLAGLRKYRRPAYDVSESLVRTTNEMARSMGVRRPVSVSLRDTSSPFTIGWMRPHVVLPKELLESEEDLRFALTHELIHVRRRDFALQLLEQVIGAVFVFHPLVALIRKDTTVLREITCDADVVARTGDRSTYARLLYRYASVTSAGSGLAVGIFSKDHQLTHRIRAMQKFLSRHGIDRSRQTGLMVFSSLLAVAVLVVACSDALVDSSPTGAAESARVEASDDVYVIVEEMPQLVGGLASVQENVVYPEVARSAGVEGRVIVQFVVNEDGKVVDPQVVRGIGSGLDEAALEAVRTAEFVPGKQRGEPVPVKISMPVTFKLGNDAAAPRPESGKATATFDAADSADGVELPRIDGGLQSVAERLRYPELARKAGIQGRVLVSFIVDENGRVQDAHIEEGLGSGLDEEALRVVRAATFTPATKDGVPQAVSMTLPITFRLPEAGASPASSDRSSLWIRDISRTADGRLSGVVVELSTETPVAAANVSVTGTNVGAATDASGRFSIQLPPQLENSGLLRIAKIGFAPNEINYQFSKNGRVR